MIFSRLRRHRSALFFFVWGSLYLSGIAFAQEAPPPVVPAVPMTPPPAAPVGVEQNVSALDLYHQGGGFMHVLLLCSIGTIAVSVYCFIQITRKKMAPQALVDQVNAAMAARDVVGGYSACQANPASYARVMTSALLKVNFERDLANKASMTDAATEALDEEEQRQMVWVNYLKNYFTFHKTFLRITEREA